MYYRISIFQNTAISILDRTLVIPLVYYPLAGLARVLPVEHPLPPPRPTPPPRSPAIPVVATTISNTPMGEAHVSLPIPRVSRTRRT